MIAIEDDALIRIEAEEYDIVINLDTSKLSSAIAANASAKEKVGFILNKKGYVEATSNAAELWLEMSAFDDLKKANTKSYQQIIYEILGLDLPQVLADRLRQDLSTLPLQSGQSGQPGGAGQANETLAVGQTLLADLQAAEPVGRLVIDLERVMAAEPGSPDDVILRGGDRLRIPK